MGASITQSEADAVAGTNQGAARRADNKRRMNREKRGDWRRGGVVSASMPGARECRDNVVIHYHGRPPNGERVLWCYYVYYLWYTVGTEKEGKPRGRTVRVSGRIGCRSFEPCNTTRTIMNEAAKLLSISHYRYNNSKARVGTGFGRGMPPSLTRRLYRAAHNRHEVLVET